MARKLLYLNGLGVLAVVLFHAAGMGFVAMFAWTEQYAPGTNPMAQVGSLQYYVLRLMEQFIIYAIPTFLFVSGYSITMVTGKDQSTLSWRVVAARLGTLLPPYVIWFGVALALRLLEGRRYSPVGLVRTFFTGSINEVMYFVPLLIQFYLLAPLLVPLARKYWKGLLLVAGGWQLLFHGFQYFTYFGVSFPLADSVLQMVPKWLFLSRLLWFPLGLVVGFHLADFKRAFEPFQKWFWWIAGACLVLGMVEWEIYFRLSGLDWLPTRETILDSIYAVAVIFGVLLAEQAWLPRFNTLASLGLKSYGVYLVHALVMEYTARLMYRFTPALLGYQIVLQPVMIVLGLGVPLLLMYLLDHSPLRRFYKLVYG